MKRRQFIQALGATGVTLWLGRTLLAGEGLLPQVTVGHVRRVFHNGEHNAFTDLVRFGGKFYLTFRSCPDGHMVHPTASIVILSSADGLIWRTRALFQEVDGDANGKVVTAIYLADLEIAE
jgi:hypothetical protein